MEISKAKEQAKIQVLELIEKFKELEKSGGLKHMSEADTKRKFIEPLFEALSWDFTNPAEIVMEENVVGKRADYGFYLNGRAQFYLEAKAVGTDIHREDFAKQAWKYAWNKSIPWAVLTDFKVLKVFNSESTSKKILDHKVLELNLDNYLKEFNDLWLLSKEAFSLNALDEFAEKIGKKTGKVTVTETLAKDLNKIRQELIEAFRISNPDLKLDLIEEGVQTMIDRLIFIRVAEDRAIEPPTIKPILREWESKGKQGSIFAHMVSKFRELDKIYNSDLFSPHALESWGEYHADMKSILQILYGEPDNYEYDFKAIPADVLGAVYENYLGYKLQKTKKDLFGQNMALGKDLKKRKEQGIYYTPKFIVDYIVKNALGPVLAKCTSVAQLKKIKILDPACGSGSFLVGAFGEIVKKYQSFNYPPDANLKMMILKDNIYGVDLDSQAVQLARLNLLLNVFDSQFKLQNLGHNIKQGNSLISGTDEELKKYFGPNFRDKKPFNWQEQFPEVFAQGGFDVIIGNPPWVTVTHNELGNDVVEFLKKKYSGAEGFKLNLFPLFVELGLDLLKKDGIVSLIIPNRLLDTPSYKGVREKFVNKFEILDIQNIPSGAFDEVVAGNIILTIQKSGNTQKEIIISNFDSKEQLKLNMVDVLGNQNITININTDSKKSLITQKIKTAKTIPLKEICDIHVGMMVKNKDEKFSNEPIGTPIVVGKDLGRFLLKTKKYFIPEKVEIFGGTKNPKKHSEHPKLFVRKTGNTIICSLDNEGVYAEQSVYLVLQRNKNFDLKFLCACLNSKLISFYFQNELITNPSAYPYIQHYDLESVPIINIDEKKQKILSQLADKISDLIIKQQKTSENSNEWQRLKEEIARTDQKIDQEVYKLYGLTDEEIKIIEKTV